MPRTFAPLELEPNEQIVFVTKGIVLPGRYDAWFWILFLIAPFIAIPICIHRAFRPVSYLITTQRVIVAEPVGAAQSLALSEINRRRGTRSALMLYGRSKRMWLNRLEDAWRFDSILQKTIEKVGSSRLPAEH